jgi:glutamine synthetase
MCKHTASGSAAGQHDAKCSPGHNSFHRNAGDSPAAGCRTELRRLFEKAICAAFPNVATEVALAPCQQAKFGDYQCNNAMAIFAQLKKEGGEGMPKNPRAVAEAVVAKLDAAGSGMIASTSCDPFFIRQDSAFDRIASLIHSKCVAGVLVLCKISLRAMHGGGTYSRPLKMVGFVGHVKQGFGLLYPS